MIDLQPHSAIETTKIYYGEEAAMKILLQAMANVKKEAVICSNANSPVFSMTMEPVKKGYIDFRERAVNIRQIVEITHDNLQYCKEFMNYVELRHMDNVKGNLAVSETEYVATSVLEGSKRSEEHTSELQSRQYLVCRLLLEKKKKKYLCK